MGIASRLRATGMVLALVAASALLLSELNGHDPVSKWLFWRYAGYWLLAGGWSLACALGGLRVVQALCPAGTGLRERLVLSFPCGVLLFFLGMFVAGLLGVLRSWFAVGFPLLLAAIGTPGFIGVARRAVRHVRAARRRTVRPLPLWYAIALAGGALGLVLVYSAVMLPENAAYDSRWYHLPIAEHYAAEGAIRRSPEGWFQLALPHLASVLYTWPYLFSGLRLFDQVEIAAHIEWMVFLWTLASIPVLVRWIVPGSSGRLSWVAVFLFPGILIYDSSLSLASDHIAALWAIPIYLALRRAYAELAPRPCLLLGAMLAGAVLTKYQAAMLITFPVLVIAGRALWLLYVRIAARRAGGSMTLEHPGAATRPLLGVLSLATATLLLTSPHWLKNYLFYGDPVYPFLHAHLMVRPATEETLQLFQTVFRDQLWIPQGGTQAKIVETSKAIFTFGFVPHDWPIFHGIVPVFGFLFSLSALLLPFLTRAGRLGGLFFAGHVGLFTWYWMSHQDRYLQALLPWLVAAVASSMACVWRTGFVERGALTLLVGLQIVWAGCVWCIPSHTYLGVPFARALELIQSGLRGERPRMRAVFGDFSAIGDVLPKNAKVLVHNEHIHAGLRRMSVSDWAGWQGGISYREYRSPGELHGLFERLGVTHLVWPGIGYAHESLASELRFLSFAIHYTKDIRAFGAHQLGTVPRTPPAKPESELVLYLACGGYAPGTYELNDLRVVSRAVPNSGYPAPREKLADRGPVELEPLLRRALFVVRNPTCTPQPHLNPQYYAFVHVKNRDSEEVWIRQRL